MKKIIFTAFAAILLTMPAFAQMTNDNKPPFQVINWLSKDVTDAVTIQNGTGATLTIIITVDKKADGSTGGINIKNCGQTTHVDAGSTVICNTNDANKPVSFNADSTTPVSGSYQIKQP